MQAWEEKYYEREKGREEGRREGKGEGRKEGKEEGRKEGLKEGKEEGFMLAKKVLKLYGAGMPPEAIARECDLSEEQVRKLVE